jgi:hypothetical protein
MGDKKEISIFINLMFPSSCGLFNISAKTFYNNEEQQGWERITLFDPSFNLKNGEATPFIITEKKKKS